MADILTCVVLVVLCVFMLSAGTSLLVLSEIITKDDVRGWFNRKNRGADDA